ncbi:MULTISPECIES: glycosyltransferase family 4 protein [Cohnella]|uniref:glycosyltransferase family 4 protein n=1 Tax=Cohnella TaxID=329857 RepID=UPI0009BC1C6E|nr:MULTISPECIES: glycosyltransferase family 4 protein [Cohnella]MBN2980675.1 glycosyltransferase family 4 protein [Cohnella algarum]
MKIAVVTPWFSDSISGGAERFAGGIAKSLLNAGCNVEILTTCGRDSFWDWGKDYYNEGLSVVGELKIRRFSLRKRNLELYEQLMGKMIQKNKLSYTEEMQLLLETVNSDSMYNFIDNNANEYIFIFIPYLYGTTFWGSKIKPSHSFIVPCVHDEDMAYFSSIGHMFQRSQGLLFNTIEEKEFTLQLHGIAEEDCIVSGGGVELASKPNPETFKQKYKISGDYFVYVGRQVSGKNVPQLLEFFSRYNEEIRPDVKLVFVGKGEEQLVEVMKNSPNIVHIGEVDDQDKYDAMAGALALIQPSLMESFSIVIMESWLCGTPVIVHELCAVTKGHCVRSGGGSFYKDYESFKNLMQEFSSPKLNLKEMGEKGRQYVEQFYTWPKTAERILNFFDSKGFNKEELIS